MVVGNSKKEQHFSNRSHVGMYIYMIIYAWIIYVDVVYCIVLELCYCMLLYI
jgi:hypothetical protein